MERRTLYIIAFVCFSLGASIELLKTLKVKTTVVKVGMDRSAHTLGEYDVHLGAEHYANEANISNGGLDGLKPIKGIPVAPAKTTPKKDSEKDKKKIAQNDKDKKKEDDNTITYF